MTQTNGSSEVTFLNCTWSWAIIYLTYFKLFIYVIKCYCRLSETILGTMSRILEVSPYEYSFESHELAINIITHTFKLLEPVWCESKLTPWVKSSH